MTDQSGPKLNILLSYWYMKKYDVGEWLAQWRHPIRVFADSGAYSAYTVGGAVGVMEYVEWIDKWGHLFDHYAALDVIGDVDRGSKNLKAMQRAGLNPVPVYHGGESFSVLEGFLDDGHKYIALGNISSAASSKDNTSAWLVKCFQKAEGKAVFHGFGMTTPRLLWAFPWYSVDSSSWSAGFRFGAVAIYVRHLREVKYLRHIKREPGHEKKWSEYRQDVARHGLNVLDFMHYDIRRNKDYAQMGALAFALMGQHIREVKPLVRFPDDGHDPGPHLYLASQGLMTNKKTGGKGRAWYELTALHYLDDNLELYS